jgi:hypothetical protein
LLKIFRFLHHQDFLLHNFSSFPFSATEELILQKSQQQMAIMAKEAETERSIKKTVCEAELIAPPVI